MIRFFYVFFFAFAALNSHSKHSKTLAQTLRIITDLPKKIKNENTLVILDSSIFLTKKTILENIEDLIKEELENLEKEVIESIKNISKQNLSPNQKINKLINSHFSQSHKGYKDLILTKLKKTNPSSIGINFLKKLSLKKYKIIVFEEGLSQELSFSLNGNPYKRFNFLRKKGIFLNKNFKLKRAISPSLPYEQGRMIFYKGLFFGNGENNIYPKDLKIARLLEVLITPSGNYEGFFPERLIVVESDVHKLNKISNYIQEFFLDIKFIGILQRN